MISELSVWAATIFPPAATLLVMLYIIWQDPYIEKKNRTTMFWIVLLVFGILILDCLNALFLIRVLVPERIVADICCYAARPLAIVLLLRVLEPEKRHPVCWVLLGVNAAIHMTALFSPICFTLDPTGFFIRGPLGYTSHIVSGILLAYMTWASVRTVPDRPGKSLRRHRTLRHLSAAKPRRAAPDAVHPRGKGAGAHAGLYGD